MEAGTLEREQENGTHPVMPDDDGAAPAIMEGTNGQLSFSIGGKTPTGASLHIVGGRVEVNGQFKKGETIIVQMVVRVDSIAFVDEVDRQTGQVIGCERRHKARVIQAPTVIAAE